MKSPGRILLLVCFFAGLLGLWWAESARIPDRAKRLLMEPRVLPDLIDTRPDELRRIEILGGDQPLTLERVEGDRWMMTRPLRSAADASLVETLALNLKTLIKSPDAGSIPADRAGEFAMSPPERTVELWGLSTDAPLARLEVGKVIRETRYVRNPESPMIEVVDSRLLSPLDLSPASWRDRAMFRIPSFQVAAIETKRPEGEVRLARDRERWWIERPWRAPADAPAVETTLSGLTSLRVVSGNSGFVAAGVTDFAPYGLDRPALEVVLRPGGGPPQKIAIGSVARSPEAAPAASPAERAVAPPEYRYARRETDAEVVLVDARPFLGIGRDPVAMRSKAVGSIDRRRVDFVTLEIDGREVALARSPRGWARVAPRADEADNQAVFEFVKAIEELQASEILSASSVPDSGLDSPSARIRVWESTMATREPGKTPSGPPAATIAVGRRDVLKRSVYLQAGDEPYILAVPDGFLQSIPRGTLAFRNRRILALGSNLVEGFDLEGGQRVYSVSAPPAGPSDKGWRLTRPAPGPADEEVLSQVLLLLGDLRVEAFVTEDPTDSQRAEFGLDKPWRVLRWTMKPDPGSKETGVVEGSLIVGAEVPNGRGSRYARLGSSEIVFKLSADQLLIFNAEWRERKVIRVEPTSIRGLRIEWESLELSASAVDDPVRSRRDLRVNAPLAGLDFDSGRIPQWLAAIGNLQAVRFVQFEGPIAPSTGLTRPRLRISIHRSDAERPITLRIGAASPDGYLFATVADGDEGSVFLLPIAAWAPLLSSPSLSFARPLAMP